MKFVKKENDLNHPTENSGESAYSQLSIIQLMHWTPNEWKTLQEEKEENKKALAVTEFQNWEKQDKKPDRTQQTHMKY